MSETLTPEQQAQQDQEKRQLATLECDLIAYRFMAATPDFIACLENAKLLNDFIAEHKLTYSVEALEQAYEACKDKLKLDVYAPPVVVIEPPPTPVEEMPAWGFRLKNKQDVVELLSTEKGRTQHIKHSANHYYGREYQAYVNSALGRV